MTSEFIQHTNCPNCGSKDNLAVYTDHEYCFGCSYIMFYNFHPRLLDEVKKVDQKIVSLPEDIATYIPAIAESWIKKYDLTIQELQSNKVVWSEEKQLLIFPYFDNKNFLWGWQGRYFGSNPKHPKWTGKGNFKDQLKIWTPLTAPKEDSIIIVEDIISTIKLSRQYNTNCLFGSIINISKYILLYNKYKPNSFIIWLDKDKRKESYIYASNLNSLGISCSVISTELDPKEYSNEQVKEFLDGTIH